jgi:hypothetical protein
MKRLILLAVFSVALVVVPSAITKTSKMDSAFGSGVRAPSCIGSCSKGPFSFNATSGTHGENPSGTFAVDFPGFAGFTANVTCLNVSGHTATLVGKIKKGTGAADPSTYSPGHDPLYFVAVVVDNGKATQKKQPSPDQMSLVGWDTEANWADSGINPPGFTLDQLCSDPFSAIGTLMFGLVSGDLTVIDR